MMQYVNNIDGRPAFELYCRVKGTRCNAIMTLIDKGWTDDDIAARFHTTPDTIHVYRLAHDDKLTTLPYTHDAYRCALNYKMLMLRVPELAAKGYGQRKIADILGVNRDSVRKWLKKNHPDD